MSPDWKAQQARKEFCWKGLRFMQTGWLSDIYLLPFSRSILATTDQMDKLMAKKASEERACF